jgi:hypothetical protein
MIKNKNNAKSKLDELSQYQARINSKLDGFENRNDYSFKKNYKNEEERLNRDLDDIINSMKDGVNLNYASFYDTVLESNMMKRKSQSPPPKKVVKVARKQVIEKPKEVEEITRYVADGEFIERKEKELEKLNLMNLNKTEYHKRQNLYLTNEMVALRVKLNKMKNKNQLLKGMLDTSPEIKNCHVMEKLITSFIETLAVNWNEIVNLIIDDLITQEVYNLNELELKKSKYNEVNVDEFVKEIKQIEKDTEIFDPEKFELDMHEINNIISNYNNCESRIADKYKK